MIVVGSPEYADLPDTAIEPKGIGYMVKVYVDNFMSLVIPVSWEQLRHVANAIMHGIHDVFPPDEDNSNNLISEKKLKKGEGRYETRKTLPRFNFDGKGKTLWLKLAKQEKLLTIQRGWIRTGMLGNLGIPIGKFKSTVAKIRHTFTSILAGRLLSPCNRLLRQCPDYLHLQRNRNILTTLEGC